jgi:hypothetical protein
LSFRNFAISEISGTQGPRASAPDLALGTGSSLRSGRHDKQRPFRPSVRSYGW